jgi:Leucine-rich repeat (LRR) protein
MAPKRILDDGPQSAVRRVWWQFSLRTLFMLMTAISLLGGWYLRRLSAQTKELAAAQAIERLGGEVIGADGRGAPHHDKSPSLFRAQRVYFQDFVTDESVALLRHLPHVQRMNLKSSELTSNGLQHLAGLTEMIELDLSNCRGIDDAGLAHLSKCRKLQYLYLDNTRIADKGLPWIASNRQLRALDLSETKVTDQGIAALAGLPELESLSLNRTAITTRSLAVLRTLPKLDSLYLGGTELDDTAIAELGQLKQLRYLAQWNTGITAAGREQLRQTLPACKLVD